MKKNVLTIALGKKLYVDMAVALARSFFLWNTGNGIDFYIVTDQPQLVPADLKTKLTLISVDKGSLPEGFSSKLFLDELAPEGQTIFIDSDCLIFSDLNRLFDTFRGRAVSVVGGYITEGEWYGDIGPLRKKFDLAAIPKFNGGIYYLEKGDMATAVYSTARELEKSYDDIGFKRFRGKTADEILMAVAMQLHQQKPIVDDGTIMSDPQAFPGEYHINVITGERVLINPPVPHPQHQAWHPFEKASPAVVHFLGHYSQHYPYRREVFRLSKHDSGKLSWVAELEAKFKIEYPERIKNQLKAAFRPIYHRLFGLRKIKVSERI